MGLTIEKCLQAWTNSLKQMNAKADIVFFGDSLIYYGDFASLFPNKVVCNLGLRGDTVQGLINRVEQVKKLEPKTVYLMVGINDVTTSSIVEFSSNYNTLIQELKNQAPELSLVLQSILPVNNLCFDISCNNRLISLYNKRIEDIAKQYNLRFIDLYSEFVKDGVLPLELTIDGIHLRQEAYNKWYDLLRYID